ncbi:MAG: hypothetical protein BWY95_02064 [Bacteroidetes bacterium ADurb.BinA104]|nr:MAG: hypothetical protein BWY95_02064 [Bacteroidetes bacterium ADurb.BinA104]
MQVLCSMPRTSPTLRHILTQLLPQFLRIHHPISMVNLYIARAVLMFLTWVLVPVD